MKYRAYIFDLDDTLYREYDYVTEAFGNVAHFLANECCGSSDRASEIKAELIDTEKRIGRGRVFDEWLSLHGVNCDTAKLVDVYRSTAPDISLYHDAERVIKRIKESGGLVGIITDGCARVQRAKIRALGLDDMADAVIITDDMADPVTGDKLHLSKPDMRVYKACCDMLGVRPYDCVYIGDNPRKDFTGARALGMGSIRIRRTSGMFMDVANTGEGAADTEITTLDELE